MNIEKFAAWVTVAAALLLIAKTAYQLFGHGGCGGGCGGAAKEKPRGLDAMKMGSIPKPSGCRPQVAILAASGRGGRG